MPETINKRTKRLAEIRERLENIENFFKQFSDHWSVSNYIYHLSPEKTAVHEMADNAPEDVKFLLKEIDRLKAEKSNSAK